jgi:threonine dehydrogenase-like Zn-dependent dehydrogenase
VRVGEMGLVIGDGLLGHWTAQTLHWRGTSVILAGKHHERLGLLPEGEGRYRVNILEEDLVEATRRLAPDGIHVLVDTVGSIATILQCHGLMRPNGHIVSAGFHGTDSMLDIQRLRFGELTLHSPSGWERRRMDETLALIASGHLQTERLITHRFPAEHAAEAWRLILEGTEPALGVVLTWAEDLSCRAEIAKHVGEQVGRGATDKSKGEDRERAPNESA